MIPAAIDITNCGLWEKKIIFEDNLKPIIFEVTIIIALFWVLLSRFFQIK